MQGLLHRRPADSSVSDMQMNTAFVFPQPARRDDDNSGAGGYLARSPSHPDILQREPLSQSVDCLNIDQLQNVARPVSPPIQDETSRTKRFSMLKFRHASDPQLATRARLQAGIAVAPAMPLRQTPEITTTPPRLEQVSTLPKKKSRMKLSGRTKTCADATPTLSTKNPMQEAYKKERRKTMSGSGPSVRGRVTFDEPERPATQAAHAPPAYGDVNSSTLALPVNRLSESSRSDYSTDHNVYATTTTTHTISTTTTFFRLPRRKPKAPLFPLPPKVIPPEHGSSLAVPTEPGHSSISSISFGSESPAVSALRMPPAASGTTTAMSSPTHAALARSSFGFAAAPNSPMVRQGSTTSNRSSPSRRMGMRGRSSTLSSLRNMPSDDALPAPTLASTRTSTSTGRKSFGDLFGLSNRLRQNSEPQSHASGPGTPHSTSSKNNSVQLPREATVVIPERIENESPAMYLVRMEEAVSRGVVASVLSKGSDTFSQQVLRSYMRGFAFFGDPMDMAIRKLLMEVELPKETQQIDRCLQGFANRYHECNPGIYASPDQAYFIAFSLLILHTDVFNKNNKHKMTKQDYIKNTKGEGIFDEILESFYDNISYTPFIHVEDDMDVNGERIIPHKPKKKARFPSNDTMKGKSKEPIDPYTLILENQVASLRPNLKDVMHTEEQYGYLVPGASLNMKLLLDTFFKTGVLQIKSLRSRPDAFLSDKTITNPEDATPGVVEIKVTKVGLLWRKDAKKKKARSPWQEWGAILTGAQLYFFRNTTWIKNLMQQQDLHAKKHEGTPVKFSPPLDAFKPDALMSTDDAVALYDSTYTKHKNAFLFVRHGGFEETFIADNSDELTDWMAKLNYASAFRTAGVRMRGILGGNYDGQRVRGIRRGDSESSLSQSVQTPSGEVTIMRGMIDNKMALDIMAARREIMQKRINDWDEKLDGLSTQLESQLRNARHLQILSPIQARSRDQLLLAAGRMSAKLKWLRLEMWRIRCHRDILIMDLAEERLPDGSAPPKASNIRASENSDSASLSRLDSKASTTLGRQLLPRSPNIRPSTQPAPHSEAAPGGDIFTTPPALVSQSSYNKSQAPWELPPLMLSPMNFDARSQRHGSTSSLSHTSPTYLTQISSFPGVRPATTHDTTTMRAVSNPQPLHTVRAEHSMFDQSWTTTDAQVVPSTPLSETSEPKTTVGNDMDKLERGKGIRRSLHKTLRDVNLPLPSSNSSSAHHHRSRKGKDSSTSIGTVENFPVAEDVLSRGTGSFTVHGKKASVITFGDEFSNMSPEERLRLRRNVHRDESMKGGIFEEDFHSLLAEPVERRAKRESAASNETTTARSFRELHRKLSVHAQNLDFLNKRDTSVPRDADSEAVSFSEGRLTPSMQSDGARTPVGEEIEWSKTKRSLSSSRQAIFYTPDQARSPATIRGELVDSEGEEEHKDKPNTAT